MERLLEINGIINEFVWGPPMLFLLVFTGVYFSIRTKFMSITKLGYVLKNTLFKIFKKEQKGEGDITAFQAVSTALAATVGTGNIAGVATAISIGGPGAIFWMWVSAIFGMTTKFAEVVLSIEFREKNEKGDFVGGPMYYIDKGLKNKKWLAYAFAGFGALAAFGIGNMVQSNSVADALNYSFGMPKIATGLILATLAAFVILGGIKKIGIVTERLVPVMAAFYILGALFIVLSNISQVGEAFSLIFASAFSPASAVGGFAGSTVAMAMRRGISRGVFSNEAGLGSAPIAHAAATTDHPVRQGLWGIFEVFMDTIVICTLTALSIMMSGVWNSGATGSALTTAAFDSAMPFGGVIVSIGILLFAFSTILGWAYYGEKCIEFIAGTKSIFFYRLVYIPLIAVGAVGGLHTLWDLSDTLNGLMAIPNLIGLLLLSPIVIKRTKEFFNNEYLEEQDIAV